MCSAPVAQTFSWATRSAAAIVTGGLTEATGIGKKIGATVEGSINPKVVTPAPQTVVDTGPAQKTTAAAGNPQLEAAQKARRAAALRAGIMSTIGPNLGSIGNTTPNMPMAYATGMKTALGQ